MAKKGKNEIFNIAKEVVMNKKVQIAFTIILFLAILFTSTSLRLSNLPVLMDKTTGNYTSNDLDSLYFYRIADTKIANNGVLPQFDVLRAPARNFTWMAEILPDVLIKLYQVEKLFSPSITFNYSATISGAVIFAMILIAFFFLCLILTKSKAASIMSSALLAYSPAFLFRSMAGFYDHDHIGVLAIILSLIVFTFSLKRFEKSWKETIIWGLALGLFSAIVLVSWGGAMTFILVCFPVALLVYYLLDNKNKENFLLFYLLWMLSSVIFTSLLGSGAEAMYSRFLDSQGLAVLFVFGFALVDYLLGNISKKLKFIKENTEKAYSFGITIILGILGLLLIGKNPIKLLSKAWATLIFPFFGEFGSRLETTVAENAQPYLLDFMSQIGNILFWLFLLGLIMLGINVTRNAKQLKSKLYFSGSIAVLFIAILCSRISSASLLNGENLISQAVYLLGALVFLVGFIYTYTKERFEIGAETLLLFALALTVVMNARSATRSFFLITPFVCLIAGYFIVELFNKSRKIKEETAKYILTIVSLISLLLVIVALFGNPFTSDKGLYQITTNQALYVGASANAQWQNSMSWVRNNTNSNDIFVHWWDYGYFIQTLAGRPTVTDGGHAGGGVSTDHFIGRYILTTSNPLTAYSFMKTWNVSYLLIDPTEMGKYGAFSKIGSNDSWDRLSTGIISGEANSQNDKETATGITRLYQLGSCVDQDINYNGTFLPGLAVSKTQSLSCKSAVGGILLEQKNNNDSVTFKQPIGAFIYNNRQINLPIKNLYFNGKMITYEEGIDAVAYVIPKLVQTNDGKVSVDPTGAVIYLSPLVKNSLMGKLYILNDYYGEYTDLNKAYFADDDVVSYLKQMMGDSLGDFVYFQGLRAPLKIWKVSYPLGTPVHREFLNLQEDIDSGTYYMSGEMDKYFN